MTGANITNLGDNYVPINEYFIQGGLFSIRGYDYLSIGPKGKISTNPGNLSQAAIDKGLAGQDIVIGGRNEVLMNAEIEFPLLKEAKVRGVIFFDLGNAFNQWGDGGYGLLASAGWGFRWFTPIGPLRFEFGYPLSKPGITQFYFTIGPPF
jgi:outer membrane protein insertion porin family